MIKEQRPPEFSTVLFHRAQAFLDSPGRRERGQLAMYLKAVTIILLFFWTYFQFLSADTFASLLLFSFLLGICHVLIPVNIVHDATHDAFSPYPLVNRMALGCMYLVGANPDLYKKMHLKAHQDKESGSRRQSIETQELLIKGSNQRNVPTILYLFYAIYMVLIRDFLLAYISKAFMNPVRWTVLILTKAIYIGAIWVVPFLLIPLPFWQIAIGIFTIYLLTTALLIVLLLMPTDPIEISKGEDAFNPDDLWVKEVLRHNVDFSPESPALNFMAGGSNMNVVHYLFPGVSHVHYLGLARIIRETAAEYGVPYSSDNVWKVFGIHWRYMLELGES